MSKKKKKSAAAESLIDSLMDDVKSIQAEASYHSNSSEDIFADIPTKVLEFPSQMEDAKIASKSDVVVDNVWDGLSDDLESSELTGHGFDADVPEGNDENYDVSAELGSEGPEGMEGLPPSEQFSTMPAYSKSEVYDGPSVEVAYQGAEDIFSSLESDVIAAAPKVTGIEEKTVSIQQEVESFNNRMPTQDQVKASDVDNTVAVEGFAHSRDSKARKSADYEVKVSVGNYRGSSRSGSANVMTSVDASLAQADNLRLAQHRILELEKEVEHLRAENEELASAGDIIRSRSDELGARISIAEKEKIEAQESAQSEILVLKSHLQYKENEVAKARLKIDELETRLKSDFKKIRVRERELENRLELLRAEKSALVRSKDEYILDQKRKVDQLSQELDNYRRKCLELNKTLEANQDQFKRTERALRLALSNLEVKEENLTPLKKAE